MVKLFKNWSILNLDAQNLILDLSESDIENGR